MRKKILKKVTSVAMAAVMVAGLMGNSLYVPAFAEGEEQEVNPVVVNSNSEITSNSSSDSQSVPDETPAPTPTPTPAPTPITGDNAYITNYRVVDMAGNSIAKVKPGDKVIVAVTVIDERIDANEFGVPSGAQTSRIHVTMNQGAFSINSPSSVTVKMRDNVIIEETHAPAICYTITFRDVTYLGGKPEFGFGISYTGENGTNNDNNMPLPYPHTDLNIAITQATDDIPAPTVILNSANYGKYAVAGQAFSLSTVATNTSENLELDNVSVKIELPQGLSMSSGNSQVLIGKVGKKGTINHTFNLVANGATAETTSLPVKLIYTFEAVVNGARTQYTSTQDISINVQQPTRFDIQSMNYEEVMYAGNNGYMSVQLVNKGKTTVYNVSAEIVSDTFKGTDVEFLGNINAGSNGEAEFDLMADMVGKGTGKLVVTYEDAIGTQSKIEKEFSIDVQESMPIDSGIEEPMLPPEEPTKSFTPYIVGVVVIAAAGGFVFYKKKQKAKRLAELEDEDEDI